MGAPPEGALVANTEYMRVIIQRFRQATLLICRQRPFADGQDILGGWLYGSIFERIGAWRRKARAANALSATIEDLSRLQKVDRKGSWAPGSRRADSLFG